MKSVITSLFALLITLPMQASDINFNDVIDFKANAYQVTYKGFIFSSPENDLSIRPITTPAHPEHGNGIRAYNGTPFLARATGNEESYLEIKRVNGEAFNVKSLDIGLLIHGLSSLNQYSSPLIQAIAMYHDQTEYEVDSSNHGISGIWIPNGPNDQVIENDFVTFQLNKYPNSQNFTNLKALKIKVVSGYFGLAIDNFDATSSVVTSPSPIQHLLKADPGWALQASPNILKFQGNTHTSSSSCEIKLTTAFPHLIYPSLHLQIQQMSEDPLVSRTVQLSAKHQEQWVQLRTFHINSTKSWHNIRIDNQNFSDPDWYDESGRLHIRLSAETSASPYEWMVREIQLKDD